jgi:5'-deoxynucleotidase YfbR-like HD superfamily hydrolase
MRLDIDQMCEAYRLAMLLGEVKRATSHPDGVTPETDSTHTLGLILICIVLLPTFDEFTRREGLHRVDRGRLLMMAAVHDLVEAYAGDVNTARPLSKADRALKDAREEAALERIRADLPVLAEMIGDYERQASIEAQIVHYLDKMTPKIAHALDGGVTVERMGFGLQELKGRHNSQGEQLKKKHPIIGDLMGPIFFCICGRSEDVLEAREHETSGVDAARLKGVRDVIKEWRTPGQMPEPKHWWRALDDIADIMEG